MIRTCFFLFLVLASLFCVQANPLRRAPPDSSAAQSISNPRTANPDKPLSPTAAVWKKIPFSSHAIALQRDLVSKLSASLKDSGTRKDLFVLLALLAFSFVYGIVHSIGPGHAKTIFFSHTMTNGASFRGMWISSALFAVTHTGMAVISFFVLRSILGLTQQDIAGQTNRIIVVSGSMVLTAGVLILLSPLLERVLHSKAQRLVSGATGLKTLAVLAGLAPCPGAFLVMVFSEIVGLVFLGVLSVVAISTGMAITVGAIGSIGATIQTSIKASASRPFFTIFTHCIRILSALLISAIGLTMILG